MIITRNNYEVFFIDYIDGSLSPNEVDMLLLFLEQNPDLAAELDGLREMSLEKEALKFEHKESLKKTSFERNGVTTEFDYLCIAENEGDLTGEERIRLDELVSEIPLRKTERKIFQKIRLEPQKEIIYLNKSKSKRTLILNLKQTTFRNAISIAAGFLILFGLFSVFNTVNNPEILLDSGDQKLVLSNDSEINNKVESELGKTSTEEVRSEHNNVGISKILVENEVVSTNVNDQKQETLTQETEQISPIKTIDFKSFETNNERIALLDIPQKSTSITGVATDDTSNGQSPPNSKGTTRTLDLFDIVQIGVQKLAEATGSSIQLSAEKDPTGRLSKINFDSKLFALSTPVRKK